MAASHRPSPDRARLEANAHLGPRYRQVARALVWQRRATGLAIEADRTGYVLEALGPVPASTRGRRAWRQAAAEIEQCRRSYQITDPERALGPGPAGPAQRADRQRAGRPSIGFTASNGPLTAPASASRPVSPPPSRNLVSGVAGQVPERAAG